MSNIKRSAYVKMMTNHTELILSVVDLYAGSEQAKADLYREVIIIGWRHYRRFPVAIDSPTKHWVYKICLLASLTFEGHPETPPDKSIDADHREGIFSKRDWLRHFIGQLDKVDRMLMALYLDSCKIGEMEDITGMSRDVIANRLCVAYAVILAQFRRTKLPYAMGLITILIL